MFDLKTARITPHLSSAVAFFVALIALPAAAAAQDGECEDVSGVYEVVIDLPGGGPTEIEVDLAQEGCTLTGYVGAMTRTRIRDGAVEGTTASFIFETENQGSGGMLEIRWEITIDGDDVSGTFSNDLFGSLEVVGSRVERGRPNP